MSVTQAQIQSYGTELMLHLYAGMKYSQGYDDVSKFGVVALGKRINIPGMPKLNDNGNYDPASSTPLRDIAQRADLTSQYIDIEIISSLVHDIDKTEIDWTNLPLVRYFAQGHAEHETEKIDRLLGLGLVDGGTVLGTGTPGSPTQLDAEGLVALFETARAKLTDNLARATGRKAWLPTWAVGLLLGLNTFTPESNEKRQRDGVVGRFAGFEVIEVPEVLVATKTDGVDEAQCIIFGAPKSAARVVTLDYFDIVDLAKSSQRVGYAVQGVHIGGYKVVRAEHVLYEVCEADA